MFTLEEHLLKHLEQRPRQLQRAKNNGVRIIGYFPGNYVPEELILASGAIPVCLIEGGDLPPLEASASVLPQVFCPFSRAQIGERLLKRNPYYRMIDVLIAPITCQHLKKVADIWEYNRDMEIFKLGVPHQAGNDFEIEYFVDRFNALKEKLELWTGNIITPEKISRAVDLYNRMRELFARISLLRRSAAPPLDSLDFVKLNHASFHADPEFMVDLLESAHDQIKAADAGMDYDAPRLLLIGPNIAAKDYGPLELIRKCGGNVVIEEVYEGIRYYWSTLNSNSDSLAALAKGYLNDRIPPAFMRYASKPRLEFALGLIDDFNVSGVIWYGLLGCETYDAESFYFNHEMSRRGIPMLILESDYGMAGAARMETQVAAFIEMLGTGL